MIELFCAPTPNGWKISIALEEIELEYCVTPVNILRGQQFAPEYLAISPNSMFTSQSIDEQGRKVLSGQQRR